MKLIIAGGRDFEDYQSLCSNCDHLLQYYSNIEIVSGTAGGADRLGEKYAKDRGHKLKQFPADWGQFGKAAGHIRNSQMADYSTHLIAFWNGKSKGTGDMISKARKQDLKVRVINY